MAATFVALFVTAVFAWATLHPAPPGDTLRYLALYWVWGLCAVGLVLGMAEYKTSPLRKGRERGHLFYTFLPRCAPNRDTRIKYVSVLRPIVKVGDLSSAAEALSEVGRPCKPARLFFSAVGLGFRVKLGAARCVVLRRDRRGRGPF